MIQRFYRHRVRWLVCFGLIYITVVAAIATTASVNTYRESAIYPYQRVMDATPLIHGLLPFDSEHFYNIATSGYSGHDRNPAFFPLYPSLVWLVGQIIPPDIAMLVVSWVATIGATIYLYLWADLEIKHQKIKSPTLALVFIGIMSIFPFSYTLILGYTESLFLMLASASLYYYRSEKFIVSGVFACLCGLTRVQGILIVIFFLVEYLQKKDWHNWRLLTPVVLAPTGIFGFMLYQWQLFGTPFQFIEAQKLWGRIGGDRAIDNLLITATPLNIAFLVVFLLLLWLTSRRLGKSYFWYAAASLIIAVVSGSLTSLNRYIVSAFPMLLALAIVFENWQPKWKIGFLALSLVLFVSFLIMTTNIYFLG
jgi:hypothetical protein